MSPETEKAPSVVEHVGAKNGETLLNSSSLDPTLVTPSESSGTETNSSPVANYTNKQLRDSTPEEFASKFCTDDSNGFRFGNHFGETAKHSKTHGWLVYDGVRWDRNPKAARERAQKLPEIVRGEVSLLETGQRVRDSDELRRYENIVKALRKHAVSTGSSRGIDATLREASVKPGVNADNIKFDSDPFLLNCQNGTVELLTGVCRDHRRDDHITKLCPVEYSPNAECPRWLAFLDEVFLGDRELIKYIQWAVGYSLTGSVDHHLFFMMLGGGCNGKGVFIRTLADILGEDYAQELNPEEIMVQRNARHDSGKAALEGVRFLSVSETEEGRRLNEAQVKKLTGGDKVRANFMRQDGFEFYPEFKLWLATNYLPAVKDFSNGMWRRIRLIPFDKTFEGAAIDPDLGRKLKAEQKGILAWCVEGAKCSRQEPKQPDRVQQAIRNYRDSSDPVKDFLDECTVKMTGAKVTKADLYEAYLGFADEIALSSSDFGKYLKGRGISEARTGVARLWTGIALKQEWRRNNEPAKVGDAV